MVLIPQPLPWSPAPGREIADGDNNVVQYTAANLGLMCLAVNRHAVMSKIVSEIEHWLRSDPQTRKPDSEMLAMISGESGRVGFGVLATQLEELKQQSTEFDRRVSVELNLPHASYTSSMEMAMTLMPDGWNFSLSMGERPDPATDIPVMMSLVTMNSPDGKTVAGASVKLPLAICAAALRAREA